MKYINKVLDDNADNETYQKGYLLELTKLEVSYIKQALLIASQEDIADPLYTEMVQLRNKFKQMQIEATKGNANVTI